MDAVEFVKAIQRETTGKGRDYYSIRTSCNAEKLVSYFEKWAKEHPVKTRMSEFLKQWTEAQLDEDGVLMVCPALISAAYNNKDGGCIDLCRVCVDCRREFWMQEVE